MRGRNKYVLHSFFLQHDFIPQNFPDKVFNQIVFSLKILYSFSFIKIISTDFLNKILMRQILNKHKRDSVMNNHEQ